MSCAGQGTAPGDRWMGGTREEYETQHFGFGANRLQLALHGVIEQNIVNLVRKMESYLQRSFKLNEDDRKAMTSACDKLIVLYIRRAAPCISNIDKEIQNILQIPANIVLPEDEEQITQMTDEDFLKLRNEVNSLQKRVKRAALMETLLNAEEGQLKSIEKHCELTQSTIEALDSCSKKLKSKCDVIETLERDVELLSTKVPFLKVKSDFEKHFNE